MKEMATVRLIAHIQEYLARCSEERLTGELLLRISFNNGGIRNLHVRKEENLVILKK